MKKISLTILTIVIGFASIAQDVVNGYGIPFVTNYDSEKINGGEQTWAGVQDKRGILYFANQNGVVEYDGHYWNLISTIGGNVDYVSVDEKGVVHVGLDGDFGYLFPNDVGTLEYVSLKNRVPDTLQFGRVGKIYTINGKTYYCSNECIFVEKNDSVEVVQLPFDDVFFSYAVGDSIVISRHSGNVNVLYDGKLNEIESVFQGGIYGIGKMSNGKYLSLGSYRLDEVNFKNMNVDTVEYGRSPFFYEAIYKADPYSISKFDDGFLLTFLGKGYSVVYLDNALRAKNVISDQNGMADGLATNSLQTGSVSWVTTCNGVSKLELGSAVSLFNQSSGVYGVINDIIEFDGVLYIATSQDVYYLDGSDGVAKFVPIKKPSNSGIGEEIAGDLTYKFQEIINPENKTKMLAVATTNGIYTIKNKVRCNTNNVITTLNGTEKFFQSKSHPELIYVSSRDGVFKLSYDKIRKKWNSKSLDIVGKVVGFAEDSNERIWISVDNQELLRYSQEDDTFISYTAGQESGLPSMFQVNISDINGKLRFCTVSGIYDFDESQSKFVLSDILGKDGNDTTHSYFNIIPYRDGYAIINYDDDDRLYWISVTTTVNGETQIFRTPFNRLPNKWSEVIYVDSKGNLWLSITDVLYCYREDLIDKEQPYYDEPFAAHIRKVLVNDSIVLFGGSFKTENGGIAQLQDEKDIPVLDYKNNSLLFQYSATFFEEEDKLVYSTMLEGADDTWSKYKPGNEYARYALREGSYTFKVKAKNIYGVESSVAEYSFVIKPPFYRTALAYIFYVIALIAGVFGIVKWNTHRLIEDKKKLERKIAEATEEIRGQNVQLEQQKDEIEKQKDEIQASINYARRIQRALLTPDETIDAIFPDHFLLYKPRNIVSGDYYWIGQFGDNKVCIVADCTGHGVPGGFMSMLGMTNLNYIVGQELRPDEILNKLRKAIITSLRQKDESIVAQMAENGDAPVVVEKKDRSQDGMDVAMYVINEKEMTLSFAGANNPLVLIRDGEVQVIKASKMPVGIYAKLDPFERVDMELKKGDCLYTFSDGFQDQFGQATGRKFMSKHLREVLLENHQKPMAEQKEILNKTYEDWRGPADLQTDDVVLMGVRI